VTIYSTDSQKLNNHNVHIRILSTKYLSYLSTWQPRRGLIAYFTEMATLISMSVYLGSGSSET